MSPLQTLYPLLLAAANLAVGAALYRNRGALLGLAVLAVGVLVVCSIACQTVCRLGADPGCGAGKARL